MPIVLTTPFTPVTNEFDLSVTPLPLNVGMENLDVFFLGSSPSPTTIGVDMENIEGFFLLGTLPTEINVNMDTGA